MATQTEMLQTGDTAAVNITAMPNWIANLRILWKARGILARITLLCLAAGVALAFLIPKMYTAQARIMPPETANGNSPLLAALAGRTLGSDSLGGLAAALMGNHASGALFLDLLRSGTVTSHMVERFDLRGEYGKRYNVDAVKVLLRRTALDQDKKSGVLTIAVRDRNPVRARDMVQAYIDELNSIVTRTNSSPAHQERIFLERRLQSSREDLTRAQRALSQFSSVNAAIDLREQTRATVESQARVQGELIATEAQLRSVQQVYGDQNVRVRGMQARMGSLRRELNEMGGSTESSPTQGAEPQRSYLPLRQVPRLAVPYADLVREVRVQETVYDLLTQQFEMSRIQEVKDVPAVNVMDPPGVPEKRSFPPRTLLTLVFTLVGFVSACAGVLLREYYGRLDAADPRKMLAREMYAGIAALAWRFRRYGWSRP